MNIDKMYECILELYKDALDEDDYYKYEDIAEDMAWQVATDMAMDMRKYVHQEDTSMVGNLCNIREDWETTIDFVKSDVRPWGRFDDMVRSMDEGTISEADHAKVQQWCMDWLFTAFGTYNIKYNFQTYISDLEYELNENE